MDHIKKWWAIYGTVVVTIATYLFPMLQAYIAAHPQVAESIGGLAVILAKISKSPKP